jgi:hypothetical protein
MAIFMSVSAVSIVHLAVLLRPVVKAADSIDDHVGHGGAGEHLDRVITLIRAGVERDHRSRSSTGDCQQSEQRTREAGKFLSSHNVNLTCLEDAYTMTFSG